MPRSILFQISDASQHLLLFSRNPSRQNDQSLLAEVVHQRTRPILVRSSQTKIGLQRSLDLGFCGEEPHFLATSANIWQTTRHPGQLAMSVSSRA